jgi:triosephosphate isomerase
VKKTLARTRMHMGAQDAGPARTGAHTGEVGPAQLEDAGCQYVILGHSERRALGETDAAIAKKMAAVWESMLIPILCVSELKELKPALALVNGSKHKKLFVAYEPLSAVGTGNPATPIDVVAVLGDLKAELRALGFSEDMLVMCYGGSTTAANAYAYLREPTIDGLLVGGSSLKVQEIHGIITAALDVVVAQDSV